MKLILFFTLLLSFSVNSEECVIKNNKAFSLTSVESMSKNISQTTKEVICDNFADYKEKNNSSIKQKYRDNVCALVNNQTSEIWKIKNRHKMGVALNQCTPDKDTKALVITFAGTGAYNPRSHSLMADLIQCKKYQYMPYQYKKMGHARIMKCLKNKGSMYREKYDQVARGPLGHFLKNNKLNKQARYFKFASFASEEMEMLNNDFSISDFLPGEKQPGRFGAYGIINALDCSKKFFAKSKELGIKPKLIIMGHSSGGRATVKFLNLLKVKQKDVQADLVITLDPVIEAHVVAVQTAGKQLTATDATVKSQKQPKLLYKTSNTKKWINFYQKSDTEGLGMGFGIQGSPITNADSNMFIKNTGAKGHGDIVKKYKLLKKIEDEVIGLFE